MWTEGNRLHLLRDRGIVHLEVTGTRRRNSTEHQNAVKNRVYLLNLRAWMPQGPETHPLAGRWVGLWHNPETLSSDCG